jgi:hypothetical protein
MNDLAKYLQATRFIDFNDPAIQAFTQKHTEGLTTDREKPLRCTMLFAMKSFIRHGIW